MKRRLIAEDLKACKAAKNPTSACSSKNDHSDGVTNSNHGQRNGGGA